jgi:hypothetical protein
LKPCTNSIDGGMTKQKEELKEMLAKQGTKHKYSLQGVQNTLHNIITLKKQEKIERQKVNSENVDRFNRIMEILECITP